MPTGVTPAGIRAGEPDSLAGLVELRGSAVRAYAGAVAEPEAALEAAAEAMASFRAHVAQATDVSGVDPDALLLRASRESSAVRAPRPAESGATLRRLARRGDSPCELAPQLLAARANRELSHEDAVRLDRHMAACPACRALRERFRTAENLYVEAAGKPLVEREAHALLAALAAAAPLAEGTPESIADEALALLPADTLRRPEPIRPAAPPAPPGDPPSPPAADAPLSPERPDDPWPGNSAPVGDPPARSPAPTADRVPAGRHGAGVGTAHGQVSFGGRRTVVIRTGAERSWSAAPPPPPAREAPAEAEPPMPPAGPAPAERPPPQAVEAQDAPARPEHPSNGGGPVVAPALPPAIGTDLPGGGPGAPPDSGTLARIVPAILIVMAIGVALLIAGVIGPGNSPATSDDIERPSLREPVPDQDATGTLRTPPAPGTEAAALADQGGRD